MCLCNAEIVSPAEKKVYKVLKIVDGYLYSPYCFFSWGFEENDLGEVKSICENVPVITGGDTMYVHGNSFHSFEWMRTAELEALDLSKRYPDFKFCVASCTIPSDTKFLYEGIYGGGPSYASESLKIDFVMSTYTNGKKIDPYEKWVLGKKE